MHACVSSVRNSPRGLQMATCDVTILGGGPVGCLLSILLSDQGVSNVVIDRDLQPYQLPRAIVMDDEIQRVFLTHGMGKWLESNTSLLERADFVSADGAEIMGLDVPPIGPLGVPPVVAHYQPDLDTMLREQVAERGGHTRWGRTVISMVESGDRVVTTLDSGETIESRWFVGCDGASSWTRKTVGLALEDLSFDQEWIVVDVELFENTDVALPLGVRQYCDPARPSTFVKGTRNYRRWEFQVQPDDNGAALTTDAGLWSLLGPWLTPDDARLVRFAVYRFHAVVAPLMQKGNVFLAGDSGHQMPPFLGQGLNSGMRDAVNLAWKMAFVKRGTANPLLLDTYSAERVPHVRSVVAHAADVGRLIDQLAGRESHGIDHNAGYGGARPAAHIEAGVIHGTDHRVGHVSRLIREKHGVATGCFVVVTGNDTAFSKQATSLRAVHLVEPALLDGSHAMVVRPDDYVAAVATDDDELRRALVALSSMLT